MQLTLPKILLLLALAAPAAAALAEPPALVGRIAAVQGQVSVRVAGDDGDAADDDDGQSLLNWPITGASRITTARGASAEWRAGSAAVRLGGDTELDVVTLDDDSFSLRLNRGRVGVRIDQPAMLPGFVLQTGQARVWLQQPGSLRVDAPADASASVVAVLAGVARVEGGGVSVTVAAGSQAEVGPLDVRVGALAPDAFDDWAAPAAVPRHVSDAMTGFEELDRYGNWRVDAEYGPVWLPLVPAGWAPYRDGRWIWLEPWGWTWIDNAPWGFAPSHYGRWVRVGGRWCWTPGRIGVHPVWAPALVGWVDGVHQRRGAAPGVGWFPLSPRDAYRPAYAVSPEHARRLDWQREGAGAGRGQRGGAERDNRRQGLTVLPAEQFGARRVLPVTHAPHIIGTPGAVRSVPAPAMTTPAVIPRAGFAEPAASQRRVPPPRLATNPALAPAPAAPATAHPPDSTAPHGRGRVPEIAAPQSEVPPRFRPPSGLRPELSSQPGQPQQRTQAAQPQHVRPPLSRPQPEAFPQPQPGQLRPAQAPHPAPVLAVPASVAVPARAPIAAEVAGRPVPERGETPRAGFEKRPEAAR